MLPRKYLIQIAKAIRNSNLTQAQRAHITNCMLAWLFTDNPAMNVKAFKVMADGDFDDIPDNILNKRTYPAISRGR